MVGVGSGVDTTVGTILGDNSGVAPRVGLGVVVGVRFGEVVGVGGLGIMVGVGVGIVVGSVVVVRIGEGAKSGVVAGVDTLSFPQAEATREANNRHKESSAFDGCMNVIQLWMAIVLVPSPQHRII